MRSPTREPENTKRRPQLARRAASAEPALILGHTDWPPLTPGKSFRDAYCARHHVAPERFEVDLLQRCLPFRARLLRPFLAVFHRHYFCIDRMFVRSIAEVKSAQVLLAEIKEFRYDSRNMTWARNGLRIRLSTNRLLDVAREVLPHLEQQATFKHAGSTPPFGRS